MINRFFVVACAIMLGACICTQAACANKGPQLGKPAQGPVLDKSGDSQLQLMLKEVAPKFAQHEFAVDQIKIKYNLFTPEKMEAGKKYPLVLFIADASTPGENVKTPLEQGYGGLVFATQQAQKANPCYVLVPQFSGVAVNDAYEHTKEADAILHLLNDLAKNNPIDSKRLYVTGQSMGGMLAMYYNIAYPEIFAASLYVDCHWDQSKLGQLVKHPFIFIGAGEETRSGKTRVAIEDAARKNDVSYAWAEWSARLPLDTQDDLAANLLGKGQPINLITFEPGTVLPENVTGSEHMYSFDCAYRLAPVRTWLFKHAIK